MQYETEKGKKVRLAAAEKDQKKKEKLEVDYAKAIKFGE